MNPNSKLSFNCAESVLLGINETKSIPNFGPPCLCIASLFGGGVVGMGELCGAVSGAIMALGLFFGTDGNEAEDEFKMKRTCSNGIAKDFLDRFREAWGSIRCDSLVTMDKGEAPARGDNRLLSKELHSHCDDYINWSCELVSQIIDSKSIEIKS